MADQRLEDGLNLTPEKENDMNARERWTYLWNMNDGTSLEDCSIEGEVCPVDSSHLWALVDSVVDGVVQQAGCLTCRTVFGRSQEDGATPPRAMCMWHPPQAERSFHCQKSEGHVGPHFIGARHYDNDGGVITRTSVRTNGDAMAKQAKKAKRNRLTDLRCAWKHATDDERLTFLGEVLPNLRGMDELASLIQRAGALLARIKGGHSR
jgi:hypothetical protein